MRGRVTVDFMLITENMDLGALEDRLSNLAAKHRVKISLAVAVHEDQWEARAVFGAERREGFVKSKEWGTLAEAVNECVSLLVDQLDK